MKRKIRIKVDLQQIILNDKLTELTELIKKLKELDVWVNDHIEYDDQNQEIKMKIMKAFSDANII